jgi:conjugal transfer pilus assembly protein TraD
MNTVSQPRRAPYWTLALFAGLLTLPFSWAVGVVVGLAVLRIAWAAARARALARANAAGRRGTEVVLGADPRGRPVSLSEDQLAAHALIVGASGAGKSTTLIRILGEQIAAGKPVVALDLKGAPAFAAGLEQAAARAGRPFALWTLDGPARWNPLAHGNPTELKDRLISSERFSEPHYRRAAERYVQTALQALAASGRPADLGAVVTLMDPRRLSALARDFANPLGDRIRDYLDSLTPDQLSAIRGLGTRLALLSESSAGPFLSGPDAAGAPSPVIDLRAGLTGGEVILFSLNASRYGSLAAQVGALAIQDLISVSGERLQTGVDIVPATVAVDEFSALGSDHVLALLARGRESGLSVLLATQELSDLERAGRGFRDQVLGLTTTKIAHRQDVPSSAQTIAEMAGTELAWDETRQLHGPFDFSGHRGTRRQVERFRVHPNVIKTLGPGEAVLLVKSPQLRVTHVRVTRDELGDVAPSRPSRPATDPAGASRPAAPNPPRAALLSPELQRPVLPRSALPRPAASPSTGPSSDRHGGASRDDQPAPGVTR